MQVPGVVAGRASTAAAAAREHGQVVVHLQLLAFFDNVSGKALNSSIELASNVCPKHSSHRASIALADPF